MHCAEETHCVEAYERCVDTAPTCTAVALNADGSWATLKTGEEGTWRASLLLIKSTNEWRLAHRAARSAAKAHNVSADGSSGGGGGPSLGSLSVLAAAGRPAHVPREVGHAMAASWQERFKRMREEHMKNLEIKKVARMQRQAAATAAAAMKGASGEKASAIARVPLRACV